MDAALMCPSNSSNPVAQKASFTGSNGTFFDHCDEQGNLVTYGCDQDSGWECSDWECYDTSEANAQVGERKVDCAGTCVDGRCESRCTRTGDVIEYGGVLPDGRYLVKNLTGGWTYRCEKLTDGGCALPVPGEQETIDYSNAVEKTCMGSDHDALGFHKVASPTQINCVLTCTADPPAK